MEETKYSDNGSKCAEKIVADHNGDESKRSGINHASDRLDSRRKFFRRLGWGAIVTFIIGNFIAFIRLFYPRVLFEPSARFVAGQPDEYPPGTVSSRLKDKYRVWIIRKEDGRFFCLSAKCTHLGCTPNWLSTQNKFKCPCHGSGFYQSGINFEGPAPRPLDRFKIELSSEGFLSVDKSIVFKGVSGIDSDELYPDSLLMVNTEQS